MPGETPAGNTHLDQAKVHLREANQGDESPLYRLRQITWCLEEIIRHLEHAA